MSTWQLLCRHCAGTHAPAIHLQDQWVNSDSHNCLRKCECPADGSACSLAAACDPQHFVCKQGWQRFSNGQPKCFKPGCEAGSLQMAANRNVQNGQAFAVCTCTGVTSPSMQAGACIHPVICCGVLSMVVQMPQLPYSCVTALQMYLNMAKVLIRLISQGRRRRMRSCALWEGMSLRLSR